MLDILYNTGFFPRKTIKVIKKENISYNQSKVEDVTNNIAFEGEVVYLEKKSFNQLSQIVELQKTLLLPVGTLQEKYIKIYKTVMDGKEYSITSIIDYDTLTGHQEITIET